MSYLANIVGFKKSEILNIIREFDPNFSFNDKPTTQLDSIFNQPTDLQQENERLQARIAELEQQLATQNSTPANVEKPIHTNTALTALFDVMNTHWQNPKTPPKQEFIKKWIVEKYPSIDPSKALWIDKIIRHQDQK
ncbi:hypothetical protein LU276_05935 [Moraxella haemolytica]|uniref:hypothetical protein n=1 Tax=Moraxella haemolytica TaxID=2904119 RepID=UPI002543E43B|nr:hypothetical protein [Moraxella sp. ZY171148]WII94571.1 hypothetical protein LU276_05935 [Moraxella sp. ZY171148]